MPAIIPAMVPVPRRESLVVEDFATDREDGAADVEAMTSVPRREALVHEVFETDRVEEAADAVKVLDVSGDVKMVV